MRYKFIFCCFAGLCFAQQEIKVIDVPDLRGYVLKARLMLADKNSAITNRDDGKGSAGWILYQEQVLRSPIKRK